MVNVISVVFSLCVFLFICLFVLCALCLTVFVNYLLNTFSICVGRGLFLFVLCVVSRCSIHMSDLCVYMRDVIF